VIWELIRWSRATGARSFDFGGVTAGTAGSDDPLGGISDFKRGFCKNEVMVGQEWALDIRPLRWRLASMLSRAAHLARSKRR
jgi:lipid II:glycine glycyltransferase (peptidoglycan interpeptide bridge formation enzyme)